MKRNTLEKSSYFILILSFLVVFVFSVFEITTISNFTRKIEKIYRYSIDYSCNYWADQFYVANKELKQMIDKTSQANYQSICAAAPGDPIEAAASELQNSLTNMSVINDNQIVYFIYFPTHDLVLTSIAHISYFTENETDELKAFLSRSTRGNTAEWNEVTLGRNEYFLHTYQKDGGVSGCFISCANVLSDIMPQDQESNAYILNMDGTVFFGSPLNTAKSEEVFAYARAVRMINKKIYIEMPYTSFADSTPYFMLIFAAAAVTSLLLVMLGLYHQRRTVFHPLLKLKTAMEEFSGGKTDIVLEETRQKDEIAVLYRTFNHMREQIVDLRIDVYDAQIEKRRIYTNFLRVQIQPHFYTNILNLIYTLADAGDCETIRETTKNMADYFRYILSLNQDLVRLADELECVEHYTRVQKIRYQDYFRLTVSCEAGLRQELIPPLLIQTFIENSIKHNIMIVPGLRVELAIEDEGESLRIRVTDNGVGMDADMLHKLENGEDIEENGKHIGIFNVMNRLHALYGGRASLSISSGPEGSRIEIHLPKTRRIEGGA